MKKISWVGLCLLLTLSNIVFAGGSRLGDKKFAIGSVDTGRRLYLPRKPGNLTVPQPAPASPATTTTPSAAPYSTTLPRKPGNLRFPHNTPAPASVPAPVVTKAIPVGTKTSTHPLKPSPNNPAVGSN